MSVTLIKQARDDRDDRLTPALKFTLMTVASHHSEKHPESGTSVANTRLAEDMGVDVRTVQRNLTALVAVGKITISESPHPRRRGRIYMVRQATPASLAKDIQATSASLSSDTSVAPSDISVASMRQGSIKEDLSRQTTSSPSGRGGQDGSVKIGNLSDDVSMPEAGAAPVKKEPAKTGTHGWAKAEFVRLMRAARVGQTGTTQGVLNRTFKKLREEGYTNEEIVSLVRTFFARHEQDIRAKRTEIDPSVMFVQRLPQLKAIKAEEIENKRAGGTTSVERGAELQREALKRLGLREDQSA